MSARGARGRPRAKVGPRPPRPTTSDICMVFISPVLVIVILLSLYLGRTTDAEFKFSLHLSVSTFLKMMLAKMSQTLCFREVEI